MIKRDSLNYVLYTPFNAAATTMQNAYDLKNPSVTCNPGLNKLNFLYTTSGVTFDNKTGTIKATPSIVQDAIMAIAVEEWRAVPDSSAMGYHRVKVGYVTRDIQFTVRDICAPITHLGVNMDSTNVIMNIDSTANGKYNCDVNNRKFQYKILLDTFSNFKVKSIFESNKNKISNYKLSHYKLIGSSSVDTMVVNVSYDRDLELTDVTFIHEVYYCTSIGTKVHKVLRFDNYFKSGKASIYQDTLYHCIGGDPLKIQVNASENISWTPTNNIVNANSDSTWVEVSPPTSQYYYVEVSDTSSSCYNRDSVYVVSTSCKQAQATVFFDLNSNCVYDSGEYLFSNSSLRIEGTTNAFTTNVTTDNNGMFSIDLPTSNTYKITFNDVVFNCTSSPSEFTFTHTGNSVLFVPVNDSAIYDNFTKFNVLKSICKGDSLRVRFKIKKTYGNLIAQVKYNSDSISHSFPLSAGVYSIDKQLKFSNAGVYKLKYTLASSKDTFVETVDTVEVYNCTKGKVFIDVNGNCTYEDTVDHIMKYYRFSVDDKTNAKSYNIVSSYFGNYKFKYKANTNYEIVSKSKLNCGTTQNTIDIPASSSGSILKKDLALNKDSLNYSVSSFINSTVNNIRTLCIHIGSNLDNYRAVNPVKKYRIILPSKSKLMKVVNASYVKNKDTIIVSHNSALRFIIELSFDSLVIGDTLCIPIKLYRVGNELDTNDNYLTYCLPAFTSYDPNNKIASIKSQNSHGDFTDKNDVVHYQINFQNTGNFMAKHIYIDDKIDSKLDLGTMNITGSSHDMTVNVDDDRKVRFMFDDIMLPDSNANEPESHGYITYTIKSNPSIEIGDVLKNKASIFFDYNPPIVTNETKNTLIEKSIEATDSSDNSNSVSNVETLNTRIYPNPSNGLLYVDSEHKDYSLSVFDVLGKKIVELESPKEIDLTGFNNGIYLIKVISQDSEELIKVLME